MTVITTGENILARMMPMRSSNEALPRNTAIRRIARPPHWLETGRVETVTQGGRWIRQVAESCHELRAVSGAWCRSSMKQSGINGCQAKFPPFWAHRMGKLLEWFGHEDPGGCQPEDSPTFSFKY